MVNPASKVYLDCQETQDRQEDRVTQVRLDVMVRMVRMASQVYLELLAIEARLDKTEILVSKDCLAHKVPRATLDHQDYLDTKDLPANKETLVFPVLKDLEVIEDRQGHWEKLDYLDRLVQKDRKV